MQDQSSSTCLEGLCYFALRDKALVQEQHAIRNNIMYGHTLRYRLISIDLPNDGIDGNTVLLCDGRL